MRLLSSSLTVTASHVVILYVWDKLKAHLPTYWEEIDSDGKGAIIPIIPIQEQPEVQDSGKPYIVYGFDFTPTGDLWQLQRESLVLRVYSQSPATIAATTKLLARLLNKHDETARDINIWLRGQGLEQFFGFEGDDIWLDEYRNISMREIHISGISAGQPAQGEASRVDATATVEIMYIEKDMSIPGENKVGNIGSN